MMVKTSNKTSTVAKYLYDVVVDRLMLFAVYLYPLIGDLY